MSKSIFKPKAPQKYTFTREQFHAAVRKQVGDEIAVAKKAATEEAVNTAMLMMLTLPIEVIINEPGYENIDSQKFTAQLVEWYQKWQDGELTLDEMQNDLWEYGGVRLEKEER